MARTKGSSGARTLEEIRKAGRELIYRHGYEAMSLRDLAREVGIQQGSLYNHIRSKQELLYDLMKEHLETIVAELGRTVAEASDPLAQLRAFVAFHLTYHMERRSDVYIANSELRSLTPPNRRKIVDLRNAYERIVIGILERGAAAKVFRLGDARIAAFALIAMLTGICAWYAPKGRYTKAELLAQHTELALRGLLSAGTN